MHIFVTGVTGFIGSALVSRLADSGHRVTGLVRKSTMAPKMCEPFHYSLGSGCGLSLPKNIDAIIHLAQSRSYKIFPADASEMFRVNVAGTQEILNAAAETGVTKFCFVSSGAVYEPFNAPLIESARLSPPSFLGASKLAGEILAGPFEALFPISILRLFTPYGPGQTARLIPDLIGRIRSGRPVSLPAVGGGMRFSPTHVDDIIDVIVAAVAKSWNTTVNVGSPEVLSIEHAAELIGSYVGKPVKFERTCLSAPTVVPDLNRLASIYKIANFRRFVDGLAGL